MELEERQLLESLQQVNGERRQLQAELEAYRAEEAKIRSLEDRYWESFNEYQSTLQDFLEEQQSVSQQLMNAQSTLERLRVTHALNDAFHIWHDHGHFGTISGCRLGRLPSQPVDWNEINAAWGQATLLLQTISKRLSPNITPTPSNIQNSISSADPSAPSLVNNTASTTPSSSAVASGFKFSTYRLLPMGSYSKMERISDKSTYELYGSSDISLGRLFWYRRFDNGMAAFLQCLSELGEFAESQDKSFRLPYKIDKDRIGDMSIKIQFNNEETWTKALKYMLSNLKFLLVWLAKNRSL